MKKTFFIILLSLLFINVDAQFIPVKFRVTFSDKNNSTYSISHPEQFLSLKSLVRRKNQNISIKANDIPVNSWYIDSVRNAGAIVFTKSRWFNCVTVYTLDSNVISKIRSFPFVSRIDTLADIGFKKSAKSQKYRDSMSGSNSYNNADMRDLEYTDLENRGTFDYGPSLTQAQMIGIDYMHEQGCRGQNMTIAVIDAGFYHVDSIAVFDSLWINNQILGTKDFVNPGGNVFTQSSHGMMVLSTMGGNIPGKIIGTAPKAKYWLLRSEEAATEYPVEEDNWVSAAEYADSVGADIINSSLGYTVFDNPHMSHSYADMNGHTCRATNGADMAASKGIVVVNSAGNSGASSWYYIGSPADADSILTAGAVNGLGVLAEFSSRGPTSDGRIKPTVCTMGEGSIVSGTDGNVSGENGTSFSSPILAGAVACLWQANPTKTNMEVINSVIGSANKFNAPDENYGYGIPNMTAANILLNGNRIYNFEKENSITVFPNPFQDDFSLVFYSNDTSAFDIKIYDILGNLAFNEDKIMKNPGCNYFLITGAANLQKGDYILKAVSENTIYTTKIIKTK